MEGDFIKINEWLLPLSWLYGLGVRFRNFLFEEEIIKSRKFDVPVISVGNLTVGGTGKTPHTEYLIELLRKSFKVAVLSRGYKRKTKGFVLATNDTDMASIGDEPYQMKKKFPDIYMAVDKNRCNGIERLSNGNINPRPNVVLLDDAYQHRYVTPGVNILLVDYHRLICYDKLLPAGRLREPETEKHRANIVIITKCPADCTPMDFRVLSKALNLRPFQKLFFTSLAYSNLKPMFGKGDLALDNINAECHVILLTGIATPQQMELDLKRRTSHITLMSYADHHYFTTQDIEDINERFAQLKASKKIIITTEKDAVRLHSIKGLSEEVKRNIYILPVRIKFLRNQQDIFNEKIIRYVRKNSRNSDMA
jgi:tetraacyldisaccharide 4'-kinase